MKNLVIGITGGIGTGKSTVSRFIEDKDYPIIYADAVAKNVMQSDSQIAERIKAQFGKDTYRNGKLNSKLLAEKVFSDKNKTEKLNSIVHPPTIQSIKNQIKELKISQSLLFVEAALIFEAEMDKLFDYVLLITADDKIRIKRLLERGNETESDIQNRMSQQLSEERKRQLSDFVLENNSDLHTLEQKTYFFLKLFEKLLHTDIR